MPKFEEINPETLKFGDFLSKGALVSAKNSQKTNAMTIGWGGLGVLWRKNVSFIFVRPQRFTFELLEKTDYYSICFLDSKYQNILNICGTKSGRDCDKIKETGLIPITQGEYTYFEQASLVLLCKKLYSGFMKPGNFEQKGLLPQFYPESDYHKTYVGEVAAVLQDSGF